MPHQLPLSGVVLAGGASRRMGFPKALIRLPSVASIGVPSSGTLLERQLSLLSTLGIEDRMVSLRDPETAAWTTSCESIRTILDPVRDTGPLGGIAASLAAARHPILAILAVDLPRISAGFFQWLLQHSNDHRGAIPMLDGRLHPLCSILPTCTADEAMEQVRTGALGVGQWMKALQNRNLVGIHEVPSSLRDQLVNLNSPSDLPGLDLIDGRSGEKA